MEPSTGFSAVEPAGLTPSKSANPATITIAAAIANSAVTAPVPITAAEPIPTMESITTAEPGARPDKDAAHKIIRSVVAIRSTGVRVIAVISIRADRRLVGVRRIAWIAKADAHRHLGVCRWRRETKRKNQNAE